jgi:signal transduction histidine kinase
MSREKKSTIEDLEAELVELRHQLYEANETIDAIRTGQVDALVVHADEGDQLYTMKTADQIYRIFIEKMGEGAVTLNKEGVILFGNSRFSMMIRLPLMDILGKQFRNFVCEPYGREFDVLFRESWLADQKRELSLTTSEGMLPVQISMSSLSLGNETMLSVILTDMTQQKVAQQELQRTNELLEQTNKALEDSNQDLQQFASVASHDLQEPLRKMNLLLSSVIDNETGEVSPEATGDIRKVMRAAARMRAFVVDVLNYSRLSSEKEPFSSVYPEEIIKDVEEDLELVIQEKNAVIDVTVLPVLWGNRGQLRQVIQNLIVNALKFCKTGQAPRISISGAYLAARSFDAALQDKGPYGLIRIKDEGIGFNQAYAENVFSLFTRLHSKDKFEGTGIGLAIAKRVVESHGGLITVRSKEDVGTEFLILLPAADGY